MGLTIHYGLKSKTRSGSKAQQLVERMRQLAMDLPFDSVSDLIHLTSQDFARDENGAFVHQEHRWMKTQSAVWVDLPWNKNFSVVADPTEVIAFTIQPGPDCEPAEIGLCRYPREIEAEYCPYEDCKFDVDGNFSYSKFVRWSRKQHPDRIPNNERYRETRTVKVRRGGWRWSAFCKTQYASQHGLANFLRCHISLITLLERIGELPGIELELEDEGNYGPSIFSDDWKQAREEEREPTYVWHPGKYNVAELAKEVGDWNAMIAAFHGAMNDATGGCIESPIANFANFEQLEFKGSQRDDVQPFLDAMAQLAKSHT